MTGAPWWWPVAGSAMYWACIMGAAVCALGAWQAHVEERELGLRIAALSARLKVLRRSNRRAVLRNRRKRVP